MPTPEERMVERLGATGPPESPPTDREAQVAAVNKMIGKARTWADVATTGKNIVAQTLGLVGDLGDIVPGAQHSLAAQLPNSEEIAAKIGGDPTHPSWLLAAFASPGPQEIIAGGKALFIGAFGAKRLGGEVLSNFEKFKKLGIEDVLDPKGYKETGWFNWFDKRPRFHISDAAVHVDTSVLGRLIKQKDIAVGKEGVVQTTVGELFNHEKAFKAYPHLKDTKINFYIKRLGDDTFEVHNLEKKALGTVASAGLKQGSPVINFYNLNDTDKMKEVVLHEIQHLIQNVENFSPGKSSVVFARTFENAKQSMIEKKILGDIVKGKVDTSDVLAPELYEYRDIIAKQYKISVDKAEDLLFESMQHLDPEDALRKVTQLEEMYIRDTNQILEELGGTGEAREWVQRMPEGVAKRLASSRYLRASGEVESRLQEYLKATRQGEIDMSRDLVTRIPRPVKPEQVIN